MNSKLKKFAPYSFYLALAAVLAAIGLYIVKREFEITIQISVVVFVLGLAGFVLLDPGRVRAALTGRQARYGSNALLLTIAFLGILIVLNYFVFENPQRWDLTEDKVNTLSDETLETLNSLPGEVRIQAFFSPQRNSDSARSMLEDYKFNSEGRISYEFIDPLTDPVTAQAAEITYDGSVVFRMDDQKEIVSSVNESEFTGALVRLMSGEEKIIYFTSGHGESSIDGSGDDGFSEAKRILEIKNYIIKEINLLSADRIPEDASAVVIAGPNISFEPKEVAMLSDYLSFGGSLVLMEDSPAFTDINQDLNYLYEYLLDTWGVKMGQDLIVDQTSILGLSAPIGIAEGTHQILQGLQGVATGFQTARSVQITDSNAIGSPSILISTVNEGSWAETDLAAISEASEIGYDEDTDLLGPVPIAVVSEDIGSDARIAVFGDVDFSSNAYFTFFGNGDLFVGTIDWVVGQEELITLTPKTPTQRLLLPPQPYLMNLLLLLVVFIMPGAVLIAGIVIWFRKRQRG